jgi:hypothetical protein
MSTVSSPWRPRLLALAISCCVAALLLWAGLHWMSSRAPKALEIRRPTPPPPARVAGSRHLEDVFGEAPIPARPEDWVFYLPQDVAGVFYTFGEFAQYDAWTYSRPKPVKDQVMPWPEHPAGKVITNLNSQGCREDHELSDPPCDLRVLVAGDSHTYGVVDDPEVFTQIVEGALGKRRPGRSLEVLNAGSGGYSFFNYLGTWFRFRAFKPQVFVVTVFGGNDFGELLGTGLHFTGQPWPAEPPQRPGRRTALFEAAPYAMAQGLDSIETWRTWPDELENSLRDAVYLCREAQRCAQADGARFVVVFLPSPFALSWPEGRRPGETVVRAYALQPEDFERQSGAEARFLASLREAGIEVIDMTPAFAAEPIPPYWLHDQHLSTRGHALTAEALLPVLDRLVPR